LPGTIDEWFAEIVEKEVLLKATMGDSGAGAWDIFIIKN
jgi:hypothetical protein